MATPEEITAVNAAWTEHGWRTRLPVKYEESRSLARYEKLSDAQLRAILRHPDERVPLATLANPRIRWSSERGTLIVTALAARGMRVNEQEGILWNPFFDGLGAHNLLNDVRNGVDLGEMFPGPQSVADSRWLSAMREEWSRLETELDRDRTGEFLRDLLPMRSSWILSRLVRTAPTIPDEALERGFLDDYLLREIASNPSLSEEQVARIRHHSEASLAAVLQRGGRAWDSSRPFGERFRSPVMVLQALESAKRLDSRQFRDLLFAHISADEASFDSLRAAIYAALRTTLTKMEADEITAFVRHFGVENDRYWLAIAEGSPLPVLRRLANEYREQAIQAALAGRVDACADPEIAGILSRVRRPGVQEEIRERGSGEPFRKFMRPELEASPSKALERLKKRLDDEAAITSLEPQDLAPLFRSEEVGVREQALGVLGKLNSRSSGGHTR